MNLPRPRTAHIIVNIPIAERPGSLFPLLLLSDGSPSWLVACYARDLQRRNWSPKKVLGAIAAIGRLYDFYHIKLKGDVNEPWQQRMMFGQFAEARLYGTVRPEDNSDPSGLYWERVKADTVRRDIYYLNNFSTWLADNFGTQELNPLEKKYISSVREMYETSIRMHTSLLAHLLPARTNTDIRPQFELHGRTGSHLKDIPKSFPADKVSELIHAAPNPRDKMIYLLMAFGSLRISEVTHLFLEDAAGVFRDTKAAKVTLGHPSQGHYLWVDRQGKRKSGTRAQYLKEMFRRVPRNEMAGNAQYAGWKGMEFGNDNLTGHVYWSNDSAGRYFRHLFSVYQDEVFMKMPEGWPGHPYLFVKLDKFHYGEPLTIANIENRFYDTCEKIGLDRRTPGVNPHGLRHFYGFYCADHLGMLLENLTLHMHHVNPLSTKVYYHISPETARKRLSEAQHRAADGEGAKSGLRTRGDEILSPRDWRSDPFGLSDYFWKRS